MSDKKDKKIGIPSIGLLSINDFAKSVEKFAKSKGYNLKANWSNKRPTFKNAVNYIREGLIKDCPVALVNMFNNVNMQWIEPISGNKTTQSIDRHWVTITGMIENLETGEVTLEVSSWGGKGTFSFNDLHNNMDWNEAIFPIGIIYFEKN